ncbi:SDR family NAD(P)-dependent oxidoreductase [Microbacterium rhizomatis]|uniref:Probable oxidoreductase n=1 Tax=Microbacterium rhizomatis TaxID=1631477 RepID=A0A5J5J021_9MICO|nr:SDR family NAD(P)-dependent oxidoreductase [Microbacterium rhizomatis]KAA9107992.1 SDR family NAD(P)-dependent oxidoreductase [Microbacterium rhizomatis]
MSSFGAQTTAAEVVEGLDLKGLRVVVTGGASGIGYETVRALAGAGAEVVLSARTVEQAEAAASGLREVTGGSIAGAAIDLTDLASIDAFVAGWDGPLDVLVANAGVMASPLMRTRYGWELQLATNHLGHFALAEGLHAALTTSGHARIVSVSSVAHVNGDVDLADLNFERRAYDPWEAYSQSKTANILFALEAASRWERDGIIVNSLNPGRISSTNLGRYVTPVPASFDPAGSTGVSIKDIPQGAATSVMLAVSPLIGSTTGRYFEDCRVADAFHPGIRRGIAPYATNPRHAAALWEATESLLKIARG